jgi:ferredoxin
MALMITDECIGCGICEPECPNQAIVCGDDGIFFIRAGRCTECTGDYDAPHCRELCPVPQCITVNPRRRETPEELAEKHRRLALRRRIEAAADEAGIGRAR